MNNKNFTGVGSMSPIIDEPTVSDQIPEFADYKMLTRTVDGKEFYCAKKDGNFVLVYVEKKMSGTGRLVDKTSSFEITKENLNHLFTIKQS